MRRIEKGARAPVIEAVTLDSRRLRLPSTGQWTLLSFLRYASCPMCNLRVRELQHWEAELESAGVSWYAFFHSPERRLMRYLPERTWRHVVADGERKHYGKYGVTSSWAGILLSMIMPSFYWRFVQATAAGYWGGPIDRGFVSMPADVLVAPDGSVAFAHYGSHIGDHAQLPVVLEMARGTVHTHSH